jgi:hypothetical protein
MKQRMKVHATGLVYAVSWAVCVAGLSLAVLNTGCKTTGWGSAVTPERVQSVTKLAAYVSAYATIQKDADRREAFERANAGLEAMIAQERWDAEAFGIALKQAGVDELLGDDGGIVVTTTVLVVDLFGVDFDLKETTPGPIVEAVIRGTQEGFELALAGTAPSGEIARTRASLTDHAAVLAKLRAEAKATRPSSRVR